MIVKLILAPHEVINDVDAKVRGLAKVLGVEVDYITVKRVPFRAGYVHQLRELSQTVADRYLQRR
jgi:hypothetical protein